jgi:hypothetical protein
MFITIEKNVETPDLQTAIENFTGSLKKLSKAQREDILDDIDFIESNGNFLILVSSSAAELLQEKRIIKQENK